MKPARAVLIAALIALPATPVQGQWTQLFSGTYTGGSNFATTASLTLGYQALSSSIYLIQVNATNLGVFGEVYKAVGIFNIPTTIAKKNIEGAGGEPLWDPPPPQDFSGDGLDPQTIAYIAPNPAPDNGLQFGQSGEFRFKITGITLAQVQNLGAGVHAISGPNDCSTKMGVQNGFVVQDASYDPACTGPMVVPEPSTVVLLATGLLGVLGVGYVRTRREGEVETTSA